MTPELRRVIELAAYIVVLVLLLGSCLLAYRIGNATDIFIGGVMAGIVPTIQAIGRIGQSETMNKMAEHLAQSTPKGKTQKVEVMNKPSDPIPVEQQP